MLRTHDSLVFRRPQHDILEWTEYWRPISIQEPWGAAEMTDRSSIVEPPFARRPIQLTAGVVGSLTLIYLLLNSWMMGLSRQHSVPVGDDEAADGRRAPLIEIDVNLAQPRELALLPGVGPVLADRIVDHRRRHGPFQTVDDLRQVYGIGPKTLSEIRHFCVVDPPRSTAGEDRRKLASKGDSVHPDR